MKIFCEDCKVNSIEELKPDIIRLVIESENIGKEAKPGQFLNLKCGDDFSKALLRRPISICEIEGSKLTIVFQVKGLGTKILSKLKESQTVSVLGPLGNGFPCEKNNKIAVVGGGIGTFPLLAALKANGGQGTAILGFRSKDFIVLEKEFESATNRLIIATDDGSYGEKGFVTTALEKELALGESFDEVYVCGPNIMCKLIASICKKKGIKCFVSLEERMGCGIGACLVCACETHTDDGIVYKHVCKDGPVFEASVVYGEDY